MTIRTALVAVTVAALAGGGTAYASGAPVAGVTVGGQGVTWGSLRYVALPSHGHTAVAQIDRATGSVTGFSALQGAWGIPQVAYDGSTGGISADGDVLVLGRNVPTLFPNRTRFALIDPVKMRLKRVVSLPGAFFFDAISPDGAMLYLIQLPASGNLARYAVRAYDLRHDRLLRTPVTDRTEPDERMAGFPVSRAASADGVWAYTLYQKPRGAFFVHALDTSAGTARCIDLPQLPSQNAPRLTIDGGRLDVVADGQVLAAMDTASFKVTRSPAPAEHTTAQPAAPQPPARRSSSGAPLWVAAPAGLFLVGLVVLAVRRRRPARARSGEAAAGAPSGP